MSALPPDGFDIVIVGGGLVGASLAAALRGSKYRIALIEAFAPDSASQPSFDERTTALGNASRRIFEAIGVWTDMQSQAAAITRIHVSDAGRFGFARLDAAGLGLEALGFVVPNRVIGRALWDSLRDAPRIDTLMPARVTSMEVAPQQVTLQVSTDAGPREIRAQLVIAADGAASLIRQSSGIASRTDDYDQMAIVASVRTDQPNDGTAWERFTPAGPMALLPLSVSDANGWRTLVWAARPDDARQLMTLDDEAFLRRWQQEFGWRAGRARALGPRSLYPLALTRSERSIAPRVALLGNASQSQHPVAGQGFNLGLRDAAELAELLAADETDPGDAQLLARFEAARSTDRRGVLRFTDTLVRAFSDSRAPVAALRDAGLLLFDLLPPAKQALSRVSLGFGGKTPRLARGLPLS
jgi:2-octaprenyl-6-methoxyphenol hydroxylase